MKFITRSIALWAFSAASSGETITLVCPPEDQRGEHKISIDTDQNTVVQDGALGLHVTVSDGVIHYYFEQSGHKSANQIHLADNVLDMAVPRLPPAVGYDRIRLACRRE